MARVTGLGGVFYKVADTARTQAWYKEMLGVGGEWGAMFPFAKDGEGYSILSPFKEASDYFSPSGSLSAERGRPVPQGSGKFSRYTLLLE